MTKKQTIFFILGAFVLFAIFYLWPWFQYSQAINEQEDEWYQNDYINKSFSGHVYRIDEYNYNPNKIVLTIDDGTEFHFNYGVTCVDDAFNEFVEKGDSVHKISGSKFITFYKPNGQSKDIELNFCDKFK
jgi:hypothetical protein